MVCDRHKLATPGPLNRQISTRRGPDPARGAHDDLTFERFQHGDQPAPRYPPMSGHEGNAGRGDDLADTTKFRNSFLDRYVPRPAQHPARSS